jgi:2-polyprenyl-6-methoxyphenol hydroxylase-like FAD-dependent oxidoreductase
MMLGYLLARSGVDVIVLEKHADFIRDFRGDTIHPSTLEVMHELGLLEGLLRLPHSEITRLVARIEGRAVTMADFSRLRTRCQFIAMMPQWDFLAFLADQASHYPGFHLSMATEATDLVWDHDRVTGVRANGPGGAHLVRAELVVAAEGRNSVLRQRAGLRPKALGSPMDVLWFRLSRRSQDPVEAFGGVEGGRAFILLIRPEHWQCGSLIPKGGVEELRQRGLESFRDDIARFAPSLADRVAEIASWDDVPLLSVCVDRLRRWYRPGLLFIGDAAHAMSPAGGVGINLAIQDAVAAANLLADPLRRGTVSESDLRAVQRRRYSPTWDTQTVQVVIGNRGLRPIVSGQSIRAVRIAARVLQMLPVLARLNGRLVGLGARPEHVTPALRGD